MDKIGVLWPEDKVFEIRQYLPDVAPGPGISQVSVAGEAAEN